VWRPPVQLVGARMMAVVVTTGAIKRPKLYSNCHHHQHTNTPTLYRPDALPVTQATVTENRKKLSSHSMDLLDPNSPGGLLTLSLTIKGSRQPPPQGKQETLLVRHKAGRSERVAKPLVSTLMSLVSHINKLFNCYKILYEKKLG